MLCIKKLLTITLTAAFLLISGMAVVQADLSDGLVAYYPFNGNANDESGNGNNGTVNGATLTADRNGNGDSAYEFNGTTNFIEVAHNDSLNLTKYFTISVWIKQYGAKVDGYRIIDKTTAGKNDGYLLDTYGCSSGDGHRMRLCAGLNNSCSKSFYSLNEWHHLVIVFSEGMSTFYLDGIEDGLGNNHGNAYINSLSLRIGFCHGAAINNEYFNGLIDDIRIYNRALSESEIQELYQENGGTPEAVSGLSCTCNTLGMPLDAASCFSESELDAGGLWKKAILRKSGQVFAQASLAGSEGGFCVQNLLWETTNGTPITDWSGLYGGLDSVGVEFAAERGDGTEVVLGSKEVKRSQFDVAVTADETFPMAGPQASAAFTASPSGGTAPYTYNWTTIMDYMIGGYGHNDPPWSSTSTADIELPAYGEKYPQYPKRWGSFNNLHQINLQVKDSAGKIAYTKCTATVATPQLTGDPSLSGSGSQLLRGVDVVSGNYHISSTDLSVSGKGPDFVVTCAYNSNINKEGAWTFNLDMRAGFGVHSMGREITISPREDGRKQYFYRELDGSWNTLNPGSFDQLVKNSDGTFTLYTQGNLFYTFADPLSSLNGCLKSISDRDGNAITFTHDADNRIIGAKDASGRNYTITRSNEVGNKGRIIKIADFTGREVQYSWNADNMLTDVKNPRGNSTTFTYTDDKLASITDPLGNTQVTIAYDSSGSNAGRVSSVTDGEGNAWTYTYKTVVDANELHGTAVKRPATNGANNNLVFVIDKARTKILERVDSVNAKEFRTTNRYRSTDSRSKIAEMALVDLSQRPSGTGTEISYSDDGKGNPTKIVNGVRTNAGANDPKLTTEAAFDKVAGQTNLTPLKTITRPGVATPTKYETFTPSGKAKSITDPLGNITNRTYQTNGLLSQSTDPRQYSTNYTYNADGTLSKVTDALGRFTSYTYDSLGRVKTTTNPKGQVTAYIQVTTYTYDANDNIIKSEVTADGVTLTTTSVYDDADNLVSVTDPRGNTVNYDYDTLNRKVAERYKIAGVERTRKFEYDAMGRLSRVINEKDDASETRFDARGKVLQEINPLSQTISYTYDENSNLLTVTDAENRTLTYQYDTLDRKTKVTDALNNYEEYRYNAQGLLEQMLDSRGFWTFYKYDALGRMTEVRQMVGTSPDSKDIITKAGYDANGNMVSVTDPNGKITTYQYDALNRMTSLKDPENRTWTFTYDENGNMLTRTTPDNKTTTYTYDGFDRVKEVRYPDGVNVGYTYDANGNRLTMTDSSGLTKYTYDGRNRLTSVTDAFGNAVGYGYDAVGLIQELTYPGSKKVQYEHDAAGRLASLKDWLNHTTSYTRDNNGAVKEILYGNGSQVKKSYDNAGRLIDLHNLTKANEVISSHQLTLDAGGNPVSANLDLPLMPAKFGKAAEMIYDASNRLTKVGDSTITHDTDGRLVADPTNGDPIQYAFNAKDLITSITKAGVLTDNYAYDGDGKRISRTTSGQTTRYVNDPTGGDLYRLLAETNASNAVQRYYIYGEGLVSQISGSTHHYYHFDQSGNTLALTNDAGDITDTYAYEPFGSTTTQGSTVNPFKFVGQYGVMDDGNGLHQMRARYYRSDLRRFVSLDSLYGEITDPMALNRYQYVSGNPMVGADPSGKDTQKTTAGTTMTGQGSTLEDTSVKNSGGYSWETSSLSFGPRVYDISNEIDCSAKLANLKLNTVSTTKLVSTITNVQNFKSKDWINGRGKKVPFGYSTIVFDRRVITEKSLSNYGKLFSEGIKKLDYTLTVYKIIEQCLAGAEQCVTSITTEGGSRAAGEVGGIICAEGGPVGVAMCSYISGKLAEVIVSKGVGWLFNNLDKNEQRMWDYLNKQEEREFQESQAKMMYKIQNEQYCSAEQIKYGVCQ